MTLHEEVYAVNGNRVRGSLGCGGGTNNEDAPVVAKRAHGLSTNFLADTRRALYGWIRQEEPGSPKPNGLIRPAGIVKRHVPVASAGWGFCFVDVSALDEVSRLCATVIFFGRVRLCRNMSRTRRRCGWLGDCTDHESNSCSTKTDGQGQKNMTGETHGLCERESDQKFRRRPHR